MASISVMLLTNKQMMANKSAVPLSGRSNYNSNIWSHLSVMQMLSHLCWWLAMFNTGQVVTLEVI